MSTAALIHTLRTVARVTESYLNHPRDTPIARDGLRVNSTNLVQWARAAADELERLDPVVQAAVEMQEKFGHVAPHVRLGEAVRAYKKASSGHAARAASAALLHAAILALAKQHAGRAAEAMKRNAGSPDKVSNAADEGAATQASNFVAALEEMLSPPTAPGRDLATRGTSCSRCGEEIHIVAPTTGPGRNERLEHHTCPAASAVLTVDPLTATDYDALAKAARRAGALGLLTGERSDSHGLCFEVRHADGSTAWYDEAELIPLRRMP